MYASYVTRQNVANLICIWFICREITDNPPTTTKINLQIETLLRKRNLIFMSRFRFLNHCLSYKLFHFNISRFQFVSLLNYEFIAIDCEWQRNSVVVSLAGNLQCCSWSNARCDYLNASISPMKRTVLTESLWAFSVKPITYWKSSVRVDVYSIGLLVGATYIL